MKILLEILFFSFLTITVRAQIVFTPILSEEEKLEAMNRARLKIKSDSSINLDSNDYYGESYDENGNLIESFGKGFGRTLYTLNTFGFRTKSFTIDGNDTIVNWSASYKDDTILKEIRYINNMEYEEVVDYGINEKEIKKTRFYHEGNRIDSTVTSSLNDFEIEITYLKGIQTEKIIRSFGKFKTIEKYYEGNSEKPFLIWYTYYDTKRRIIKRTQEFLNHKETTEYISKFGDKDKPDIEELLINGKIKSTTTNYKDKKGNYIKTHYKENEYETITCRTFNLQNLEIKSIIETIENGVKTEAESWIHKYEFY